MSDLPAYGMEFQDDDAPEYSQEWYKEQFENCSKECFRAYDDHKIAADEIRILKYEKQEIYAEVKRIFELLESKEHEAEKLLNSNEFAEFAESFFLVKSLLEELKNAVCFSKL